MMNEIYEKIFGDNHELSEEDNNNGEEEYDVTVEEEGNNNDEEGDDVIEEDDENNNREEEATVILDSNGIDGDDDDDFSGEDLIANMAPVKGMEYDSKESLMIAYQDYAKVQGFSVAIRSSSSKYYVLACFKGRKPKDVIMKFTRQTQCPARVNCIVKTNGKVIVSNVELNHNHSLEPQLSMFMPGNRELSLHMKRLLKSRDIAGFRTCKNVRTLEVMAGGPQNLGVTERVCRNFIDKRRRLRLGEGDAKAIHGLFFRMQLQDKNFFHIMDVDDEGRMRNVMWVHSCSIAAYEEFHDVVSFDTTYLVNKYKMPLATVVGVNHHNQSILLGCGLLSHEQSESFKWFFSNWLLAMKGVQPTAMLTDQCESIKIAVKAVFPMTIHRLCLWHIASKLPQKFKGVADFRSCSSDFYSTIYNSLSIAEFESRWTDFLSKHGLHNNRWLKDLFDEKENWAPIYLNHIFWAGMVSTQRSESMHAFFDGFVNSKSTLKLFVEQYEIAIQNKIQKEMNADYQSKCVMLKLVSTFQWEKQLLGEYTHNIGLLLQVEIKKISSCNVEDVAIGEDGVHRCKIKEMRLVQNVFHKEYTYTVEYRPFGEYIKGIFCVHIFKVLVYKDINHVHDRYIMKRWRAREYRPHSSIVFAGGYPHMTEEFKAFQDMERSFVKCADAAITDPRAIKMVKEAHEKLLVDIMHMNRGGLISNPSPNGENARISTDPPAILDPPVSIPRGRPRADTRLRSNFEINTTHNRRGGGRTGSRGRRSNRSQGVA
ncbi:hypothetical protein SASPL_113554 [Salvia splendens]|uniref:Protein FAR1-RELATED SEQUENCE n=1 Tax=Salvia splendens TaxID=180675 RepID=A0A8X8Y4T8_SALSN|nr:hypothetical protein SASPL_113554 [Salvia splendens]